jgi:hypothetical protein
LHEYVQPKVQIADPQVLEGGLDYGAGGYPSLDKNTDNLFGA